MQPQISKYLTVGPGGRKCNCCFPAPGSKARKAEYRKAKRSAQREVKRLIIEELSSSIQSEA